MSRSRRSRNTRRFPSAGPTPVGQRLRAATIQGRRHDGPTVEEWDEVEVDRSATHTSDGRRIIAWSEWCGTDGVTRWVPTVRAYP